MDEEMEIDQEIVDSIVKLQKRFKERRYYRIIRKFKEKDSGCCVHKNREHWLSKIPVHELLRDPPFYQAILTCEKIKHFGLNKKPRPPDEEIEFDKKWRPWNCPSWLKEHDTLRFNEIDLKF